MKRYVTTFGLPETANYNSTIIPNMTKNFVWFSKFALVNIFCRISNLIYQNFLYGFRGSHDSVCLKMEDSQFVGNLFTKLHDFIPRKPVTYIQVFLPTIYIAYFHVTICYNHHAGRIPVLFVTVHTVCLAETWTATACLYMSNLTTKQKADAASANSRNSKPRAPPICKFQAVHRCERCATSCLFICGLLKGALDSLEFVT